MAHASYQRYVALGDSSTEGIDDPDGAGGYRGWSQRLAERIPDLATARVTINATFDMHGESPEVTRTLLMRMVDRALLSGPRDGESEATVVDHMFESSSVVDVERRRATDTDFSQLLDI